MLHCSAPVTHWTLIPDVPSKPFVLSLFATPEKFQHRAATTCRTKCMVIAYAFDAFTWLSTLVAQLQRASVARIKTKPFFCFCLQRTKRIVLASFIISSQSSRRKYLRKAIVDLILRTVSIRSLTMQLCFDWGCSLLNS